MSRHYTFAELGNGYVRVIDPEQHVVLDLVQQHAVMVCAMYANLLHQNERAANEFMYGHLLGVSLTLINIDAYPKIEPQRDEKGNLLGCRIVMADGKSKEIGVTDPETKYQTDEALGRLLGGLEPKGKA